MTFSTVTNLMENLSLKIASYLNSIIGKMMKDLRIFFL